MNNFCTIELFLNGRWHEAAGVTVNGPLTAGWEAASTSGYTLDHAIAWPGHRDAHACSHSFPVSLTELSLKTWPAFLMDLLPQGHGRQELLRQLELPATAEHSADWPLLLAGAGNPIGNMRIKEAALWLQQQNPGATTGFTFAEVAARSEGFLEFLASHGLFVAGSSGVQGEWPKILLTEAEDGLLYLDHSLPDSRARRHWLVKFGRGENPDLAAILRAEAPYMQLAKHLGLRVHGDLLLHERALFIPRFDREVRNGQVIRHAQESLASFCSRPGFGVRIPHNDACRQLAQSVTNPLEDVIEYVRRDVANIVLGNKDNHARNTAVLRREDGYVGLAPLFDFAPMLLHPDGIARISRWTRDDGGNPDWGSVIQQVTEATGLPAAALQAALHAMAAPLQQLPECMATEGVDPELIERLRPIILETAHKLAAL